MKRGVSFWKERRGCKYVQLHLLIKLPILEIQKSLWLPTIIEARAIAQELKHRNRVKRPNLSSKIQESDLSTSAD